MFHTFHEQVSPMEVPRIGNDATEVVLTHVLSRSLSDRTRGVSDSLHPTRPLDSSAHRAPLSAVKLLSLHLPLEEGFIKFGMLLREGNTTINPRIFQKTRSWV
jgi:hypothetical protein